MIYGVRSNGNQHGLVLTKSIVVETMLDKAGYIASRDLSSIKILEPAAGDGAFAISIVNRLYESSKKFHFSFQDALSNIYLYEIDQSMASALKRRITSRLKSLSHVLPKSMITTADFLLSDVPNVDVVIGNPPYVRHENIPETQKDLYRKQFGTFSHRSDLFIAFYEKSLRSLNQRGVLSFICSNRWLKNQYGKRLREYVGVHFSVDEIIDLEGTNPFEEDVIAYPAITIIRNSTARHESKYIKIDKIDDLKRLSETPATRMLHTHKPNDWFMSVQNGESHEKYLDTIVNQGFKIGIGVATGSDETFIRNDFQEIVEKELLLPILTSRDLKGNKFKWSGKYILNPFSKDGDLIDLSKFPKAKSYLESHKSTLVKRHVSVKSPQSWYKTIDKINPELTYKDKIILPDISGNSYLFIDRGNYYPHHNLYYITGKSYEQLALLAAVLMSDFVRDQLSELGNKMNGGYPRWQSQNLKKLLVPIIDAIPKESSKKLFEAYQLGDIDEINNLVTPKRISDYEFSFGQSRLFEPSAQTYHLAS
jgi:adenine-specific DNA-methyltransferase